MRGLPSWAIHAASERRSTARGLGSSGNIVWAITGSSGRSKTIVWWFCSSASEIAKKVIVSALQMDDLVHLDALSFSIHFPIKGSFKSAKCRRSSALELTTRTLPRFRCRFDSDRPLQILKDLRRCRRFPYFPKHREMLLFG